MNNNFIITGIDRIIYFRVPEGSPTKVTQNPNLPSNELIFFIGGSKNMDFNKKSYIISPQTVHFLPKGNNNQYDNEIITAPDGYDIFFQTDTPISTTAFVQSAANNEQIHALFRRAFHVWSAKNDGYYFECISILYKIFSLMQQRSYLPSEKIHLIDPAVKHIEEHFRQEIDYKGLAEKCGLSYTYFKQLFIYKYGISPNKYITRQRLNYACDLLKTGNFSISEISELSGFKDVYYFSRVFSKNIGVPPSKYC